MKMKLVFAIACQLLMSRWGFADVTTQTINLQGSGNLLFSAELLKQVAQIQAGLPAGNVLQVTTISLQAGCSNGDNSNICGTVASLNFVSHPQGKEDPTVSLGCLLLTSQGTAFAPPDVSSIFAQNLPCPVSNGALRAHALSLAPLQTESVAGQNILADQTGMTLYVFDKDIAGVSNCNAACATAWPPTLLPAGQSLSAPLGTIKRQDGGLQITFNGRPVYRYSGDQNPGDTNGDGLGHIWHIVPVTP